MKVLSRIFPSWISPTISLMVAGVFSSAYAGPNDSNWIQLLRPDDVTLSDWIVKIEGQPVGVNMHNSFSYAKAKDGSPRLEVIDTIDHTTSSGMGHLFYKKPFSDYLLRAQFHFPTKVSHGGAGWTIQNNGLMLHCQSPSSMGVTQAYPNSIEDQLLGYWSSAIAAPPKSTSSNVCVPGVTINYKGQWYSDASGHHCTEAKYHDLKYDSMTIAKPGANSTNATWAGADVWQYAQAKVLDSSSMTFWVKSRPDTAWDSVMGFTNIHLGQASSTTNLNGAKPLSEGYIAIQMEGTSTEFAKIELLNLAGCMNPADTAFRNYFVKSDPSLCSGTTGIFASERGAQGIFSLSGNRVSAVDEILDIELYNVRGIRVPVKQSLRARFVDIGEVKPGLYAIKVRTRKGTAQAVYTKL